jgi:hypothetical protein
MTLRNVKRSARSVAQRRHGDRCEDADDRHDDQKLEQGEAGLQPTVDSRQSTARPSGSFCGV